MHTHTYSIRSCACSPQYAISVIAFNVFTVRAASSHQNTTNQPLGVVCSCVLYKYMACVSAVGSGVGDRLGVALRLRDLNDSVCERPHSCAGYCAAPGKFLSRKQVIMIAFLSRTVELEPKVSAMATFAGLEGEARDTTEGSAVHGLPYKEVRKVAPCMACHIRKVAPCMA